MTNDTLPIRWAKYPSVQGYKETILAAKPGQTNSRQEFKAPIQLSEILSQPNFMATYDPPGKEQMHTLAPWTLLVGHPPPKPYPWHLIYVLFRWQANHYLGMHHLSFLLNMLPTCSFTSSNIVISWIYWWSIICSILHELDQLHHYAPTFTPDSSSQILIE